ncbi:hypothetical protein [Pseudoalteromonas sp. S16_S37]|uniref:hypothetical protein n=1 Tax=Pseudoalteromonas sp. S16_S37 TaxID=2720228 RepID=UPI00168126D9|nr:hypothetical protein [Pseudoalteromonas sp. S16_S37]MBD1580880.1 hypothetical protein [Pseudoalteromonas sp. S16_S37]
MYIWLFFWLLSFSSQASVHGGSNATPNSSDNNADLIVPLKVNGTVTLKQNQAAQILYSVRYPVITIENQLNTQSQVVVTSGSGVETLQLPAGQPVLWPYNKDVYGNAVRIKNSSPVPSTLTIGYFSFAGEASYLLTPEHAPFELQQYESAIGITQARLSQLYISCPEPGLIALFTGNAPASFLAIKTTGKPPQSIYQYVASQVKYIPDNYYQISNNWWGQALAVVNVSPQPSTCQINYGSG